MTKEEKDLLLTDLCARLPYEVKVQYQVGSQLPNIKVFNARQYDDLRHGSYIDDWLKCTFKPCLYPLSSMTEEQKKELFELCTFCIQEDWEGKKHEVYAIEISSRADQAYCYDHNFYMWGVDMRAIDWLNKNHFDYRGLIEKGLAVDCTNLDIY